MAKIHNSEITKEVINVANIQVQRENAPSEVAEKIVPTLETNPKIIKEISVIKTITNVTINSGATAYTTPSSGQDFYLLGYSATFANNATSQATYANIQYTPVEIAEVSHVIGYNHTGAISQNSVTMDFGTHPIKIKKGTTLRAQILGTAVGASVLSCIFYGYLMESN